MSDNSYAAPKSNLTGNGGDNRELLAPLIATKPWVRFLSILGFVLTVFMVIVSLIIMVGGAAMGAGMGGGIGAGIGGTIIGVFYLLFSLLYFFPSLYLYKYASAIGTASESNNTDEIIAALGYQKSFWKFAGIMGIIMCVFMGLGVVVGGIGGFMAASMGQ